MIICGNREIKNDQKTMGKTKWRFGQLGNTRAKGFENPKIDSWWRRKLLIRYENKETEKIRNNLKRMEIKGKQGLRFDWERVQYPCELGFLEAKETNFEQQTKSNSDMELKHQNKLLIEWNWSKNNLQDEQNQSVKERWEISSNWCNLDGNQCELILLEWFLIWKVN